MLGNTNIKFLAIYGDRIKLLCWSRFSWCTIPLFRHSNTVSLCKMQSHILKNKHFKVCIMYKAGEKRKGTFIRGSCLLKGIKEKASGINIKVLFFGPSL